MASLELHWSDQALTDLDGIVTFIMRDSRLYAARVLTRSRRRRTRCRIGRTLAGVVPELRDPRLREVFVHSYRIIYRRTPTQVAVLMVVHGARDLGPLWQREQRTHPSDPPPTT